MTSLMPVAIAGHIVPGKVDPFLRFSFVTNKPYGPPAKIQHRPAAAPQKPRDLGDEGHQQLLGAIKGIGAGTAKVQQQATQIADALPGFRDWR